MKKQLVWAFEQVRTHLSGRRGFTSTASSRYSIWFHLQHLDPSPYSVASYSHSTYCPEPFWNLILTQNISKKIKKNTPPTKDFHLKCNGKCLMQLRMYLDSTLIHLCIFRERQTAESSWYHVRSWAFFPCLSRRNEWHCTRRTRQYWRVCLCMCVLLYPSHLPPPKASKTPMMHAEVFQTQYDAALRLQAWKELTQE